MAPFDKQNKILVAINDGPVFGILLDDFGTYKNFMTRCILNASIIVSVYNDQPCAYGCNG